jgi:hypothetical protein
MYLTCDHELQGWSRHLKIHATIFIRFGGGGYIELIEWNFLRSLFIQYPERSAGDRVIVHFFHMLIAENERRRWLGISRLRMIPRFDISLQPVNFSVQRLEIAPQSAVIGIRGRAIRVSIGIRRLIIGLIVTLGVERIVIPAVVRIVASVRIIEPGTVEGSTPVGGIPAAYNYARTTSITSTAI